MPKATEFLVTVPPQTITTTDNQSPDEESIAEWLGHQIMEGAISITIVEITNG